MVVTRDTSSLLSCQHHRLRLSRFWRGFRNLTLPHRCHHYHRSRHQRVLSLHTHRSFHHRPLQSDGGCKRTHHASFERRVVSVPSAFCRHIWMECPPRRLQNLWVVPSRVSVRLWRRSWSLTFRCISTSRPRFEVFASTSSTHVPHVEGHSFTTWSTHKWRVGCCGTLSNRRSIHHTVRRLHHPPTGTRCNTTTIRGGVCSRVRRVSSPPPWTRWITFVCRQT